MWYSFPKCIENAKWKTQEQGKTVHSFCVLDGVSNTVAPKCASTCGQTLPSGGKYNKCYFDCFYEQLLGKGWDSGNPDAKADGTPVHALEQAFTAAFGKCAASA